MKTYLDALEEMRERLRVLHEQACKARDESQKTATAISTTLFDIDKLQLAFLKEQQGK